MVLDHSIGSSRPQCQETSGFTEPKRRHGMPSQVHVPCAWLQVSKSSPSLARMVGARFAFLVAAHQ